MRTLLVFFAVAVCCVKCSNYHLYYAQGIPEAPSLPPLNYGNLPKSIRNMIHAAEKSNLLKFSPRMKHGRKNQTARKNLRNDIDEKIDNILNTENGAPNTWGVKLISGNGYVWNTIDDERTAKMNNNPEFNDKKVLNNLKPKLYPGLEVNQIEVLPRPNKGVDVFVQEPSESTHSESWGMRLTSGEGYIWHESSSNSGVTATPKTEKHNVTFQNNIKPSLASSKDMENQEDSKKDFEIKETSESPQPTNYAQSKPKEPQNDLVQTESEDTKRKLGEENPFIFDEFKNVDTIVKNEPFWKWLEDWTSFYVDNLVKHVLHEAREVLNKTKPDKNQPIVISEEKTELDNGPDETNKYVSQENHSDSKLNDNDKNQNNDTEEVTNGVQDIPEIDHRINTNDDYNNDDYDGDYYEETEESDKEKPPTIIYGNSIGNEKVTNIFLFYPQNPDKALEQTKPILDSIDSTKENGPINEIPTVVLDSKDNVTDKENLTFLDNNPIKSQNQTHSPDEQNKNTTEENDNESHRESQDKDIEENESVDEPTEPASNKNFTHADTENAAKENDFDKNINENFTQIIEGEKKIDKNTDTTIHGDIDDTSTPDFGKSEINENVVDKNEKIENSNEDIKPEESDANSESKE